MPKKIREYDDDIYAMRVDDRLTIVAIAAKLGISKTLVGKRLTAMGVNCVSSRGCRSASWTPYGVRESEVVKFNRTAPL